MQKQILSLLFVAAIAGTIHAQEKTNNRANPVAGKKANTVQTQTKAQEGLEIGNQAPDFTQNNRQGTPIALSSLRGKYVLIDFWASWCGPCRKENPDLIKTYAKYKSKNFEIIAVSLDDKKEKWENAIETDLLPWLHVCDLTGLKSPILRQYQINGIPTNYLLDPNGVIIAKELHKEHLDEKLKEILK